MNRITHYVLHDPIGNLEGQITEFDQEKLKAAEAAGMVFIAVREDGTREIVKAEDVHEITPQPTDSFTVATPKYVDQRVEALLGVIEKMAEAIKPKLGAAASLAVTKAITDCKAVAKPYAEAVAAEAAAAKAAAADAATTADTVTDAAPERG